jgi:hypothetical protein
LIAGLDQKYADLLAGLGASTVALFAEGVLHANIVPEPIPYYTSPYEKKVAALKQEVQSEDKNSNTGITAKTDNAEKNGDATDASVDAISQADPYFPTQLSLSMPQSLELVERAFSRKSTKCHEEGWCPNNLRREADGSRNKKCAHWMPQCPCTCKLPPDPALHAPTAYSMATGLLTQAAATPHAVGSYFNSSSSSSAGGTPGLSSQELEVSPTGEIFTGEVGTGGSAGDARQDTAQIRVEVQVDSSSQVLALTQRSGQGSEQLKAIVAGNVVLAELLQLGYHVPFNNNSDAESDERVGISRVQVMNAEDELKHGSDPGGAAVRTVLRSSYPAVTTGKVQ